MLPSPSALRAHDFSRPIKPWNHPRPHRAPRELPFAPASRIAVTQQSNKSPESSHALTSLVLPLSLAQKIHNLILTSRQLEMFTRGLFSGTIKEREIAQRMHIIEGTYNELREEVECELESVWVNAGLIPANLPPYPVTNLFDKAYHVITANDDGHTVDGELKRKREDREDNTGSHNRNGKKNKCEIESQHESVDESTWVVPALLQPLGIPKASIPLASDEKRKLKNWGFEISWGCGGQAAVEVMSPRSSVFAA